MAKGKKSKNKGIFSNMMIKRELLVFSLICAALFAVDFFYHPYKVHFKIESYPGFYAAYGFVVIAILVLIARFILRPLVSREEDYYDR